MTIPENRLSQELGFGDPGLISRRILTGRLELSGVVSALRDAKERMLAYEMALRFCESDGALSKGRKEIPLRLAGPPEIERCGGSEPHHGRADLPIGSCQQSLSRSFAPATSRKSKKGLTSSNLP